MFIHGRSPSFLPATGRSGGERHDHLVRLPPTAPWEGLGHGKKEGKEGMVNEERSTSAPEYVWRVLESMLSERWRAACWWL